MPIDYERFPEIPRGAKLQPTADPDVGYVFADDAATGERLAIGMIRHGVFTPASAFSLVKAHAALADRLAPPSPATTASVSAQAAELAAPAGLPDAASPLAAPAKLAPFQAKNFGITTGTPSSTAPVTALLSAVFFALLAGGATTEDAARFYAAHRDFLAKLTGETAEALPGRWSPEAFRRFLAILNPRETSQLVQKTLLSALARPAGQPSAPQTPPVFDADRLTLAVVSDDASFELPSGYAYGNAIVAAEGGPAQKAFFKSAIEASCDWVARLSPDDAAAAPLVMAAEKALAEASPAEKLHGNTNGGVLTAVAGMTLPKTLQKALTGLASGMTVLCASPQERQLAVTSLPATIPGLQRAATIVQSADRRGFTVFFPEAVGNAVVMLNLAVLAKVAKAVRKNEARRRAIAGLPALTKAETDRFLTDPAGAAQSTAAFLSLV